jgi:hypothetical protein
MHTANSFRLPLQKLQLDVDANVWMRASTANVQLQLQASAAATLWKLLSSRLYCSAN